MSSPKAAYSFGFVLILGSFDAQTKRILSELQRGLSREFGGSGIYPILLDSTEAYTLGRVLVLEEKLSPRKVNLHVFGEDKTPLESYIYSGPLSTDNLQQFIKEKLDPELIPMPENATLQRMNVSMKLKTFFEASVSILTIRHRHETRGGEIAELMHALMMGFWQKVYVIKKEGFPLSGMVLEFLDQYSVPMRTYNNSRELMEVASRLLSYRLAQ